MLTARVKGVAVDPEDPSVGALPLRRGRPPEAKAMSDPLLSQMVGDGLDENVSLLEARARAPSKGPATSASLEEWLREGTPEQMERKRKLLRG